MDNTYTTRTAHTAIKYDPAEEHLQDIRRNMFSPAAILASPEEVYRLCDSFFHMKVHNRCPETNELRPIPPTAAGLAVHLGFASRQSMMNAIENEQYEEQSRYTVAFALTQIEEYVTEGALMDKLNVNMSKFTLSATLNVVEKKEINTNSQKTINYVISTAAPTSTDEAIEMDRLETALKEQTANDLMVSGRIKPTEAEATKNSTQHQVSLDDL